MFPSRHPFKIAFRSLLGLGVWLCLAPLPRAMAGQVPEKDEDFFEMSIEDLANEPYQVVSASRQAQKIGEISVPVSVVTHEDIHNSGLTSIPDVLRFYPGVDVLTLDRNCSAVGVRGLHDFTSDRTLTLINGRTADSALFGGSEYFSGYPVLMEDVDHIEIVRGPGGAAWGANAFTGMINIITKKPEDVLGVFASTTVDEYGDSYNHVRWAGKEKKWKWRMSVGYEDRKSSDAAGAGRFVSSAPPVINGLIGFDSFVAQDFCRDWRLDSEAFYSLSDRTVLSLGAGYVHNRFGDFEFGGFFPEEASSSETLRPYARIDHRSQNGNTGYVQWYANMRNARVPSLLEWNTIENDLEGQFDFEPWERHRTSLGGNVRSMRVDTRSYTPQDFVLNGEPLDEQSVGFFLIDHWSLRERMALEGQIRGDWYSETQTDLSSRVSALYSLDPNGDHTLRASIAKSFRTPLSSLRELSTQRIALGPGLFAFNVPRPDDLENEETWSLEGGYTGHVAPETQVRVNTYYQRYERMIGYQKLPDPLGLGRAFYRPDNIDGADSWGAELEIEKTVKAGKVSAWYAYNDFHRDEANQNLRSYGPARHKVGLTARLSLLKGWALNARYRYTDTTPAFASTLIPADSSHRLDLNIAIPFNRQRGEVMIGVNDILTEDNGPVYAMGHLTAHETPGRTFFGRIQYKF